MMGFANESRYVMRTTRLRGAVSIVVGVSAVMALLAASQAGGAPNSGARTSPAAGRTGVIVTGEFRENPSSLTEPAEEYDEEAQVRQSLRLRPQIGLRSDEAYVRSIVRGVDPVNGEQVLPFNSEGTWYIPMTVSERDWVNAAQQRSQRWSVPVRTLLENDPRVGFAGYYLLPKTGQVTVGAVNVEYTRQRLATLPGALNDVAVVAARHTLAELNAAAREVADLLPNDADELIPGVGVDEPANELVVTVTSLDRTKYPPGLLAIAERIRIRYDYHAEGPGPLGGATVDAPSIPTTHNPDPSQYAVPGKAPLRNVGLADISGSRAATVDGDPAIEISYLSGIESCGLLSRVEVNETVTTVTIGVFVGDYQPDGDAPCAGALRGYRTLVKLRAPIGDREVIDRFIR